MLATNCAKLLPWRRCVDNPGCHRLSRRLRQRRRFTRCLTHDHPHPLPPPEPNVDFVLLLCHQLFRRESPETIVLGRKLKVAFGLLGWLIVVALLLVALFRIVAWDDVQIFSMADALGMIVYLPAWVVGSGAAGTRQWALLAASAVVVAAQLAFGLPELTAATPVPTAARHAFTFRLFDANVYKSNPSMAGYAAQLRADRPDLATLEEATPFDRLQLQRAGVLRSLPYVFEVARFDSRAFLIASRYRLGPATVSSINGLPFLVRTSLHLPGGTIPLWVVHTTAPVNPGWHQWYEELQRVDQLLRARAPGPLLIVGDFNATWGNRWFRAILTTGLTDAAAARGDPFDMTWSQMFFVFPPLLRIDHVLTTPDVVVTTIHSGPGPGSDHRDLRATVAVLPSSRPEDKKG
jgi:endonuclease/exonuclease/phosphatase (EEP) superfamily protein YafD